MNKNPEFIVYVGPMASGKTSLLLAALERYKYRSKKVYAFKPYIDERYSTNEIVTHNGLRWPATQISDISDIIQMLLSEDKEIPDVVALDEAFMLSGSAKALAWLYRQGVTVLVSTLDLSSKGEAFEETKEMMAWATQIYKCSAVCTVCGADARYTHRKIVDADHDILIGGLDIYDPRCLSCHPLIKDLDP